ncbi:hypothetical protein [Jatrophihabitans lederbergiae]|uniref:DUF4439 domain-containing protein n=1 Tax=Jatrophihabitans lederbergiae TaxID=3075547 RepID=A0ABU2JE45_9ACTN|nr:hypothetical protein [Jatrophihabitans sp. DSM 44399]MDT0263212.1 hypothetical protein [Jatrophihabitans sp. DSM 44399]
MNATDVAAIVAACGGLAAVSVAAGAIVVGARNLREQLQVHESTSADVLRGARDNAAEDRRWQREADTYVDVLAWTRAAMRTPSETDPNSGPVPVQPDLTLQARVDVFACEPVREAFAQVVAGIHQYPIAIGQSAAAGDVMRQNLVHAVARLQEQVRAGVSGHEVVSRTGPSPIRYEHPIQS